MTNDADSSKNARPRIAARKTDIIWNYVGTIASMGSNFLLIPLLLVFLTTEQMGLWYVFIALSGLAQLLEFGFTSTLSRNIVYCLSGARRLTRQGCDSESVEPGVDWHLMRSVMRASKAVYAIMGLVGLVLASTLGSAYVFQVTAGFAVQGSLLSWCVFVASIFSNLYFLYCLTFLRGVGDIAGENKAKTLARVAQIVITAVLLIVGLGLLAASIGYFLYSFLLRLIANIEFGRHADLQEGLKSDTSRITQSEILEVLRTVSFVASRDGIVSLAWYGATQAASLISSIYFGLEETATYSVMLQFATAIHNISGTYIRSFFPAFQSASLSRDEESQRGILERGMSCYVALFVVGTIFASLLLPVLTLFREDFVCDQALFYGIALYYFLLNQHSLYCCLIVSMNEIPYFKAYLISTGCGILLSCLLCGIAKMGPWGLVIGQALPQLAYNNWRWPKYVLDRIGITYFRTLRDGFAWWLHKIKTTGSDSTR